MTAANPPQGQPQSPDSPMPLYCLDGVCRAGGMESARTGREDWRNQHLIRPNEPHEEGPDHNRPLQQFDELPTDTRHVRTDRLHLQPSDSAPASEHEHKINRPPLLRTCFHQNAPLERKRFSHQSTKAVPLYRAVRPARNRKPGPQYRLGCGLYPSRAPHKRSVDTLTGSKDAVKCPAPA